MRLLLSAVLLAGCFEGEGLPAWDVASDPACEGNSPPVVGNLETNSTCINENNLECRFPPVDDNGDPDPPWDWVPDASQIWTLGVQFAYRDPGVEGAGDPPNMVGGLASGELDGHSVNSAWLVDVNDYLPTSEEQRQVFPIDPDAETGIIPVSVEGLEGWTLGSRVRMAFRVYDGCEAVSNDTEVEYLIGFGHWIDGEPVEEP